MERIPQQIIDQMSKDLVGKKVRFKKEIGKCDYFGYSFFESWGLQITIDRTPFSNVDIKDIEVIE
jgi:hypothetical protein